MIEKVRVGGQYVSFDPVATRELYATKLTKAGADECDCMYCKHFAAQRKSLYPAEFLELLARFGIDPLKELEAFDYDFGGAKQSALYGGWFLFVGEILEGMAWRPPTKEEAFSYWFTDSFPSGDLRGDRSIVAVEFIVEVPWVNCESHNRTIHK